MRHALRTAAVMAAALQPFAARGETLTPELIATLGPDVSEEEWTAAVPAETVRAKAPERVSGPLSPQDTDIPPGATARVVLDVVYRANGTVGVYRIIKVSHLSYAKQMVTWLRAGRFQPFVKDAVPIAVRGKQEFTRSGPQIPLKGPSNKHLWTPPVK